MRPALVAAADTISAISAIWMATSYALSISNSSELEMFFYVEITKHYPRFLNSHHMNFSWRFLTPQLTELAAHGAAGGFA